MISRHVSLHHGVSEINSPMGGWQRGERDGRAKKSGLNRAKGDHPTGGGGGVPGPGSQGRLDRRVAGRGRQKQGHLSAMVQPLLGHSFRSFASTSNASSDVF